VAEVTGSRSRLCSHFCGGGREEEVASHLQAFSWQRMGCTSRTRHSRMCLMGAIHLGHTMPTLPSFAPEQSRSDPSVIVEAVSGTDPMDTLDPSTPSVSHPIQEPLSTPAIPVVTPPHPAAYSDISSESDYDLVEDVQLVASQSRGTLTDLEEVIREDSRSRDTGDEHKWIISKTTDYCRINYLPRDFVD